MKPILSHTPVRRPARASLPLLAGVLVLALLPACSILGGKERTPTTIYTLNPQVAADPSWPQVDWQLALPAATASAMVDSMRVVVRPRPNELQVYKGARWSDVPPNMVEEAILHTLERSGRIGAVARQGSGVGGDYRLVLDVRRFESEYAGAAVPSAVVEVNAKLLHAPDQQIVAGHTFSHATPATGTEVEAVVQAFEQSLESVTAELAGWILTNGDTHEALHR